jgi:hypothetical protein
MEKPISVSSIRIRALDGIATFIQQNNFSFSESSSSLFVLLSR